MIDTKKLRLVGDLRLHTHVEIGGSADRVWEVLTDFSAYSAWNPFLRQISGPAVPGGRATVVVSQQDQRTMTFRVRFTNVDRPREIRWKSGLPLPGLLDSEHYFCIKEVGPGTSLLEQGEIFHGVLVRFLSQKVQQDAVRSFEAMNEALKRRVEAT